MPPIPTEGYRQLPYETSMVFQKNKILLKQTVKPADWNSRQKRGFQSLCEKAERTIRRYPDGLLLGDFITIAKLNKPQASATRLFLGYEDYESLLRVMRVVSLQEAPHPSEGKEGQMTILVFPPGGPPTRPVRPAAFVRKRACARVQAKARARARARVRARGRARARVPAAVRARARRGIRWRIPTQVRPRARARARARVRARARARTRVRRGLGARVRLEGSGSSRARRRAGRKGPRVQLKGTTLSRAQARARARAARDALESRRRGTTGVPPRDGALESRRHGTTGVLLGDGALESRRHGTTGVLLGDGNGHTVSPDTPYVSGAVSAPGRTARPVPSTGAGLGSAPPSSGTPPGPGGSAAGRGPTALHCQCPCHRGRPPAPHRGGLLPGVAAPAAVPFGGAGPGGALAHGTGCVVS